MKTVALIIEHIIKDRYSKIHSNEINVQVVYQITNIVDILVFFG